MTPKRFLLASFVTCAVLAVSSIASACSLSLTEWEPLQWNRVSLSGGVVKKVAERVMRAPEDFNGAWEVHVSAYALAEESNPESLVEARKQLAIHVVRDVLQVPLERFTYAGTKIYPKGMLRRSKESIKDIDSINISVIPICPPGGCHFCGEPMSKPETAH
ncbi:hypothetical protein GR157_24445 [Burkholderia sp. 4701]|nr:hypothetical protein [Burkholderia sp. 4701]MXN85100.1 hypothetical protein [Burkholderia sp. 4812]